MLAGVIAALMLVGCALFGAVDQYLGSLPTLSWGTSVSLLSAPWLLVAFCGGWTRRGPRSAMLMGLGCTYAALLGYGLMTLSSIEGANLTAHTALAVSHSETPVIVGGLVTGPLFGWFGFRWRATRAWLGALLTALAFCFEPVADTYVRPGVFASSAVPRLEISVGVLMAIYVVIDAAHRHART